MLYIRSVNISILSLLMSNASESSDSNVLNYSITKLLSKENVVPTLTSPLHKSALNVGPNGSVYEEINSFYFYETEQLTVLWVLFIVIVVGNLAVLTTLFFNKTRKSRMNYFICQLAIADLFVGLLNVLTDIIWRLTVSWRAGEIACKVIRFMQACVTYSSTYVLVALSIDRYDAITNPMNFSGSWTRAKRLVAGAWIISACFSIPMIFLYEEKVIQDKLQCWIELGAPWRWQLYMCLISSSLFFIPAIIISTCYAIILKTIWTKGGVLASPNELRNTNNIDRGSRRASSRGIIPRAKIKTVKMTIVIVIVFVICWSPYIVFDLLQVFGSIPKTQTNIAIATFMQSLSVLNSATNPLIYCLFSTQICLTFRRGPIFGWFVSIWCCRSQETSSSSDGISRTLTTTLTISKRSIIRPTKVVIVERPITGEI
ncbi:cardioacceleratory peptide receptor isoform X1 [Culicoides brevitarsis]|uniref:cardioacceleratory peptide receptor isoform X1 n=1 Tax=Culicoides brevitarsis TaxID=469753 RepID=UPI00307C6B03